MPWLHSSNPGTLPLRRLTAGTHHGTPGEQRHHPMYPSGLSRKDRGGMLQWWHGTIWISGSLARPANFPINIMLNNIDDV